MISPIGTQTFGPVIVAIPQGQNFVVVAGLAIPFLPTDATATTESGSIGTPISASVDRTTLSTFGATFNLSGAPIDGNQVLYATFTAPVSAPQAVVPVAPVVKCNEAFGIMAIPVGQTTVQITGLGLPNAPYVPELTVLAPSNAPDFIFAFLIGTTTTDGFTVGFSAPPSVNGYAVKWKCGIPSATPCAMPPTKRYGVIAVPQGQEQVQVTGLGLWTAPYPPLFTVITPANPPDFIFAYLVGQTSTDGFIIGLSAPPSVAGYSIKWECATPFQGVPTSGSQTAPVPLLPFKWTDRESLISGRQSINGNSFRLSIDPYGQTFFVFPEVDDNHQIVINWDGIRNCFAPGDAVPFDEECAGVVAEYVRAWMAKGAHDWSVWGEAMKPGIGSYYRKMRSLFLNAQNRTQMRMG